MADPTPTPVAVLAYGGGPTLAVDRRWLTVGVVGVVVALGSMLLSGGLLAVSTRQVWQAVEAHAAVGPPRPLTAAETATLLAGLHPTPPLTAAQVAFLSKRLQSPGQCWVAVPSGPGPLPPPSVIVGADGTLEMIGGTGDGWDELTLDAAGHVRRELATHFTPDGTLTDLTDAAGATRTSLTPFRRPGFAAVVIAGGAVALTSAADAALAVLLLGVAVRILRRAATAAAAARRYGSVKPFVAALAAVALIALLHFNGTTTPFSLASPEVIGPVVLGLLSCVYPAVLLTVHRRVAAGL